LASPPNDQVKVKVMKKGFLSMMAGPILLASLVAAALAAGGINVPVIPNMPASPTLSVSTVPSDGDVNPYGVAFVPPGFSPGGPLKAGDILISNFNNSSNLQGTGTTVVAITTDGQTSVFFQGEPGLGLTTALGVLRLGFVLVGNLPTTDGTSATVQQGSLLVLDRQGDLVANLTDSTFLDGPWDLAVNDMGGAAQVFVSNVLNGTVSRLDLKVSPSAVVVEKMTTIASGYLIRTDPAALVVGPTGLAFDRSKDILYVASTGDNAVFAIPNASRTQSDAGMGTMVFQDAVHLHGPLGLAMAPNGDLLSSQGDAVNPDPSQPSEIVEFTPTGEFVTQFSVDPSSGAAFGLALTTSPTGLRFAAVDDGTNMLNVWNIKP
jgi:hypothetical protein